MNLYMYACKFIENMQVGTLSTPFQPNFLAAIILRKDMELKNKNKRVLAHEQQCLSSLHRTRPFFHIRKMAPPLKIR